MKSLFVILNLLFALNCFTQKDSSALRHAVAMQFGGQTMVSLHHEYSFIARKHIKLNSNIGFGINEHADDTDSTDRPIYGIHSGLILLCGVRPLYLEIGLNPSTYFFKENTFVNLNSWFGIRFTPKKMEVFNISIGYTPRLYTSFTDQTNRFFNAKIGVKLGVSF